MDSSDITELDLQREVQALRTHRRLSASHLAVLDPDLPDLHKPADVYTEPSGLFSPPSPVLSSASNSPPTTPPDHNDFDEHILNECSPIFGSIQRDKYLARRQGRIKRGPVGSSPPLPPPPASEDESPEQLWVPASLHPEVNPSNFRSFLREQAEKNMSQKYPSDLGMNAPPTSPDMSSRYLARSTARTRRASSLRRQFRVEDWDDSTASAAEQEPPRSSPLAPEPTRGDPVTSSARGPVSAPAIVSPQRSLRDGRSHRKPAPVLPPEYSASPESPHRYMAPVPHDSGPRPAPPARSTPSPTPSHVSLSRGPSDSSTVSRRTSHRSVPLPRPVTPEERKLTPADLRTILPQKGDLPELPAEATTPPRTSNEHIRPRRPLPDVRSATKRPEHAEGPRPLPTPPLRPGTPHATVGWSPPTPTPVSYPGPSPATPPPPAHTSHGPRPPTTPSFSMTDTPTSRASTESEPATATYEAYTPTRKSDEPSRPAVGRDRKGFGLSWFGLAKDDDETRHKKKERATDEGSSSPRREKDTFLTNIFSKRKGLHDSYRNRARQFFGASSSTPVPVDYSMYDRYPVQTERALYRLSHFKLTNPRRPLYQQVIISNLMFWYLSVINSAQARPASLPPVNGSRNGPSEYDEASIRTKPGTGPVATHTGSLVRSLSWPASASMMGMYTPTTSQGWVTDHGSWPASMYTPPDTPVSEPATPTMPRSRRGPLPSVPTTARPSTAETGQSTLPTASPPQPTPPTMRPVRHAPGVADASMPLAAYPATSHRY